jgi:uncharacterized protein YkwD
MFFSVSCTKAEGVKNPPVGGEINAPNPVNKGLLLQLVNDVRKKGCQCGDAYYAPAPPLVWNDLLEKAAYNHANDMFQHNFFSHTGQDGSTVSQRMERVGYDWMAYGENIGMGFRGEKEVIEAWLQSPGHCKNLMNIKFKEMAVARVGNYWTQTFGSK